MLVSHIIKHIFARHKFFLVVKCLLHYFANWVHFVVWVVVIKATVFICGWGLRLFVFFAELIDVFVKFSSCFFLPGHFPWFVRIIFWLAVA